MSNKPQEELVSAQKPPEVKSHPAAPESPLLDFTPWEEKKHTQHPSLIRVGRRVVPKEALDWQYKNTKDAFIKTLKEKIIPHITEHYPEKANNVSCFISYAWGDPYYEYRVQQLVQLLTVARVKVFFDRWEDRKGKQLTYFVEKIREANFVLVVGTPLYLQKYEKRAQLAQDREHVVRVEASLINHLAGYSSSRADKIIPLLFEGNAEESLPFIISSHMPVDFVHQDYFDQLFYLIRDLYQVNQQDKNYERHRIGFKQLSAAFANSKYAEKAKKYRKDQETSLLAEEAESDRRADRLIQESEQAKDDVAMATQGLMGSVTVPERSGTKKIQEEKATQSPDETNQQFSAINPSAAEGQNIASHSSSVSTPTQLNPYPTSSLNSNSRSSSSSNFSGKFFDPPQMSVLPTSIPQLPTGGGAYNIGSHAGGDMKATTKGGGNALNYGSTAIGNMTATSDASRQAENSEENATFSGGMPRPHS